MKSREGRKAPQEKPDTPKNQQRGGKGREGPPERTSSRAAKTKSREGRRPPKKGQTPKNQQRGGKDEEQGGPKGPQEKPGTPKNQQRGTKIIN